jgi:hypothetical protein
VQGRRASVKDFLDELGNGSASGPLLGESGNLLLGRDLTGDEQPEETFWEGLAATWSFGEEFLALGNGLATESDTLVCKRVEDALDIRVTSTYQHPKRNRPR